MSDDTNNRPAPAEALTAVLEWLPWLSTRDLHRLVMIAIPREKARRRGIESRDDVGKNAVNGLLTH